MTQKRGQLTPRITEKSLKKLGYEITQVELRLIPYLIHCVLNSKNIEHIRVNIEETQILKNWEKKNYIQEPFISLKISDKFYLICQQLMFLGYVDIDNGKLYKENEILIN